MATDHGHLVYRCYSHDGELLYVGTSLNMYERLKKHRQRSAFWTLIKHIELDHCDDRKQAYEKEKRLISAYSPRFNILLKNIEPASDREGAA